MSQSDQPAGVAVDRGVRPHLLPDESPRYWGVDHLGQVDYERGLLEMCDYGAAQFHAGRCDLVNFDCMPIEVDRIKAYMAEKHPGVAYAIGPARRTLARAISAWEASKGPNAGGRMSDSEYAAPTCSVPYLWRGWH